MHRIRAVLLIGAFALWPSSAFAQIDLLWEWAEHWSGPGPWDEKGVNVRIYCSTGDANSTAPLTPNPGCWSQDEATTRNYIDLRVSLAQTGGAYYNRDNPRYEDTPADTRAIKALAIQPQFMVRLNPTIDVGAGIGFVTFYGSGFDAFPRLLTTPLIVSIAPLAMLQPANQNWRWLEIRFEEQFYPHGFEGKDFGDRNTAYKTRNEWVRSAGFVFDIPALVRLIKN